MRVIPIADDVSVGVTRQNTIMFQRIGLRTYAYRKLFKIRKEDDLDDRGRPFEPDAVREVLVPYRSRPNRTRGYPMNGERERARRIRQLERGIIHV